MFPYNGTGPKGTFLVKESDAWKMEREEGLDQRQPPVPSGILGTGHGPHPERGSVSDQMG